MTALSASRPKVFLPPWSVTLKLQYSRPAITVQGGLSLSRTRAGALSQLTYVERLLWMNELVNTFGFYCTIQYNSTLHMVVMMQ
jgi:hypothetical protein